MADTTVAATATAPQLVLHDNGNAVAVWQQNDGTRETIWAGSYSPSTGKWGTATLIESDDNGAAYLPEIAVSRGGNAMVMWTQTDGGAQLVWANNYSAGQWGQALIMDLTGAASKPKVAIDASGNAIAVWQQYSSQRQRNRLITQRYANTGAWSPEQLLKPDDTNYAFNPTITFNSDGNAIAAWQQFDGTLSSIWTRFYSADNGWRTNGAEVKDSSSAAAAINPQVILSNASDAVVVWQQFQGTYYGVMANSLNVGTNQWGTATQVVTTPAGSTDNVRVAKAANGDAIAVWSQLNGTRRDIWTSRYSPSTGAWSTTQLLETDNTGNGETPHIAAGGLGNAIAVWSQKVGALTRIWANIFINDRL
jgi:hypothetical protein